MERTWGVGLKDLVEFRTGDPSQLLQSYENIDFSLVDCKNDNYTRLLKLLDVNPRKSMVVANNLVGKKKGLEGHLRRILKEKAAVRSMKNPVGKGMEVTMINGSNSKEGTGWSQSVALIRLADIKAETEVKEERTHIFFNFPFFFKT
jgi:hypothetical protein